MIRNRTRKTEAIEAGPDEDQAAEPEAVPDDLAAAAAELRRQAAAGREEIARHGEETQAALDEIARQVASLQAQAKSLSVTAGAEMTAKGRWVSGIEEQARYVEEAARHKTAGEADLERASTLTAERDDLTARVEGLESRLVHLDAERQDVARQLTAATETADVDLGASLRPRADQLTAAIASLTGQGEALRERLEAIGTGQEHGELYEALSAAAGTRLSTGRCSISLTPTRLPPATRQRGMSCRPSSWRRSTGSRKRPRPRSGSLRGKSCTS